MALFLIEHQHTAETCPTRDPNMVRALRDHVTEENAERHGLKLLADWVDESDHRVVMVVESDEAKKAEQFAAPFANAGSVSVKEGQTCDETARLCLGE